MKPAKPLRMVFRVVIVGYVFICHPGSANAESISSFRGCGVYQLSSNSPDLSIAGSTLPGTSTGQVQFGQLPMSFEPNYGQVNPSVRFLSRGHGYALFLEPGQVTFVLRVRTHEEVGQRLARKARLRANRPEANKFSESVVRMRFVGADPHAQLEGQDVLPGVVSYFLGNEPRNWRVAIPSFSKVKYRNIYPGIDLQFYGNQQELEYDFLVSPYADPDAICIEFEGADKLELGEDGGLIVHVQDRQIHWRKPVAYQPGTNGIRQVVCEHALVGNTKVGFVLGGYDRNLPLVIDPVLVYATYFGGSGDDYGAGVAVDSAGNIYITGSTSSTDLPVTNAYRGTPRGGDDVFVAKLNSTGTALLYSTYLGGSTNDVPTGIAVDAAGNAYVVGWTESTNFPTQNAYQSTFSRYACAFVARLGPWGTNLLYSSYLGNTVNAGEEYGYAICVDGSSNAYIAGVTFSGRYFRTKNPFQSKPGGFPNDNNADAFVAKFNTAASGDASLVYSSWLGGSSDEFAHGIAVDAGGNVYVTGEVDSNTTWPNPPTSDFPTTAGAFQRTFNGGGANGVADAFVTKINAAGSALVFSTFLGGDGEEAGYAIAVDATGKAYVVGETSSYVDFPVTAGAAQPFAASYSYQAFVTVFNASGSGLLYSTYLGGSASDFGRGIGIDNYGLVYVTGEAGSFDFPVTVGADQTNRAGGVGTDVFVAKINPNVFGPASLVYASYFGGNDDDSPTALAVDTSGSFYVVGWSSSTNLPAAAGTVRPSYSGGWSDAFVAKFSSPPDLSVAMQASTNPVLVGSNLTYTLWVNNNSRLQFSGVTVTNLLPTNFQFVSASTPIGNWTYADRLVTFNLGVLTNHASVQLTITVTAIAPGVVTNTAAVNAVEAEPNMANNIASVRTVVRGIADLALTAGASPNPVVASSNLTYTCAVTNKGPWPASSVVISNVFSDEPRVVSTSVSPGGSCTNLPGCVVCNIGNLAVGGGSTVTIIVAPVPAALSFTNKVAVTGFELDGNPVNNSATVITSVTPLADLGVCSIVGAPDPVYAGSNVIYTVSLTNLGPSRATGLVLSNPIPSGFTFVPGLSTPGCFEAGGVVLCALTNVAKGAAPVVSIVYRPNIQGTVTNIAWVQPTAPTLDPASANNMGWTVTTVLPSADLAVSLAAQPSPVLVGSNLTYTITVTNRGPTGATGVSVICPMPADTIFVAANAIGGTCERSTGAVSWRLGTLSPNASATATVIVKPTLDGPVSNVVAVSSDVFDPVAVNNTAIVTNTVIYNPDAVYLRITGAGTNVVLYWSTNAWEYKLQAATNLGTDISWVSVTNLPVRVERRFYVTNSASLPLRVYRLVKPIPPPGPRLQIMLLGTNAVVFWPTNATGFVLHYSPVLSTDALWTSFPCVPVQVDECFFVTDSVAEPAKFYRLQRSE